MTASDRQTAVLQGLFDGIRAWRGKPHRPPEDDTPEDLTRCYTIGYVTGTVIQTLLVMGLAYLGISM